MNLDELKTRWEERDRRLDAGIRLNARLLRASTLGKAETAMRRLSRWLKIELALDSVALLWLGSFIADHVKEPRFLLPAALLHLGIIGLLFAAAHQLAAVAGLDFGAPIVEIQRRLERLRVQRIRATQVTLLLAPLAWIPLFIVALESWLGVDVYAMFPDAWLVANVLLALAVIPAAVWLSRRYAGRMTGSSFGRRLVRDIAGHSVNAAAEFLDSLARFEKEERA